jgi:hypothetical protein
MDPSTLALSRQLPAGSRIILDVLTALTYRNLTVRSRIIGCAMERGVLTCWYSWDGTHGPKVTEHEAIQLACDTALQPPKRWTVAPLQLVTVDAQRDRKILDRGNLTETHPLMQIPRQYQLGLIEVAS